MFTEKYVDEEKLNLELIDKASYARRDAHPLLDYPWTCIYCEAISIDPNPAITNFVPNRCELCSRDKYRALSRKKIERRIEQESLWSKLNLVTFTLKDVRVRTEHEADELAQEYFTKMKASIRKLTKSHWWRSNCTSWFYSFEYTVKPKVRQRKLKGARTEVVEYQIHPHIHMIVESDMVMQGAMFDVIRDKAVNAGLGSYVYWKRIRSGHPEASDEDKLQSRQDNVRRSVRYVLKYMMKHYGDNVLKGRYYELGGKWRKPSNPTSDHPCS